MTTPAEEKRELRKQMRSRRIGVGASARRAASLAVCARLQQIEALTRPGAAIAIYLAKGDELDLDDFIQWLLGHDVNVAAPVYNKEEEPHFAAFESLHNLETGVLELRMPPAGAAKIPDHALDAVLFPGLAFDRQGGRLGYGGGWYDKVAANLREDAWLIGIGFDCQLVEEVPGEAHDVRVDLIVTESQIIHARHPDN